MDSSSLKALATEELPDIPRLKRTSIAHKKIKGADWRFRDFLDINAKGTEFENVDFRYSRFEGAYFEGAKFTNCRFTGSNFYDCNLRNARFYTCDLQYVIFSKCLLDVKEIVTSIPSEPNLRRDSIQNLRANAREVGDSESDKILVFQEIEATKLHYRHAASGYNGYYKKKYSSFFAKLTARAKLFSLNLSGLVWGYGEKPSRLLWSCLVFLSAASFINIWSTAPRLGWDEINSGIKVVEYVVQLFLDMNPSQKFKGFEIVDYIVVMLRYIYIGLFVSVLYKSIAHR